MIRRARALKRRSYLASPPGARKLHRHPVGLSILVFAALVLVSGGLLYIGLRKSPERLAVTPNDNFIVILHADGAERTLPTDAETVGELLQRLDIRLQRGDTVEPAANATIATDNFLVNVYRSVPVAINDDGKERVVHTAAVTPRSIVAASGTTLYGEDEARIELVGEVMSGGLGRQVVIERSKPILLTLYGQALQTRTRALTVQDLLREKSITLKPDDTVKPAADTPVTADMQISVVRNGVQVITVTEDIAAPVKTVVDASLSFGSQAVRQEGSPGKKVQTYEINVQGGEEVSRRLLQSVVTVQPVERIVAKGNTVNIPADKQSVMAAAGISPGDYAYVDYIFSRESRWNAAAVSPNGYYGLGQTSLARLSAACPNWQSDPVCQTRLFTSYATGRYGSWEGAYNFWLSRHWW